jgi:CIC family chloride channel protein
MKFKIKLNNLINYILLLSAKYTNNQQFIIIIAILTGLLSGLIAVVIKNSVHLIQWLLTFFVVSAYQHILYLFYPSIGIGIVYFLVRYVIRRKPKAEIPDVIYAIQRKEGKLPASNIWITTLLSSITVGFGGSVGLEGPSATTAASMGSNIAQFFKLNRKLTQLLIGCASAGAIASLFKAPIAGVVFALEIFMLDLTMSSILPLLISATVGAITSYLFFGNDVLYNFDIVELPNLKEIPFFIILGLFTGFFSIYFIKIKYLSHKIFRRFDKHWKRWLFGGLSIGIMIFFMPSLYGEGYQTVNSCLNGNFEFLFNNSPFYSYKNNIYAVLLIFFALIILKSFATFFTFEAGGIGGIFAPILFLGSSIGFFVSLILIQLGFNVVPSNFAMVAMAGMLSGIMFAPLTGIFLIAEITNGYDLIIPLMIVSSTSYAIVRMVFKYSIYNQVLAERGIFFGHHKSKNVISSMKIADYIEKNFITVYLDDTLRKLTEVISKSNRNIYPVVDKNGFFLGIVFLDNIKHLIFKQELYDKIRVSDLYFMPEATIDINDSMENVVKIFYKTGNYNIPVVDKGKYVGFVSRANIFTAFQKEIDYLSEE